MFFQDRFDSDCWVAFQKIPQDDELVDPEVEFLKLGPHTIRFIEHNHFYHRKFKPGDNIEQLRMQKLKENQEQKRQDQFSDLRKKEALKI